MASTYRGEVIRILEKNGCYEVRVGRHPIWFSPTNGNKFPVPNNIDSRHTANEILKQAGLPKKF